MNAINVLKNSINILMLFILINVGMVVAFMISNSAAIFLIEFLALILAVLLVTKNSPLIFKNINSTNQPIVQLNRNNEVAMLDSLGMR